MTIAVKAVRPLPHRAETRVRRGRLAVADSAPSEHLAWRQPVAGLWVAETPSAYLGMIEETGEGFVASAADGRTLGVYPELAEARIAVYANWFRPAKSPGLLAAGLAVAGLFGWLRRTA
ncbi:hypothetical protein [Leifsonia shinshuensis]|uniref:Uncharacterized protein n=1 Tax=Leifsonia shinshuensis TaxID=150026 RepID=A0A853CPJ4_9MICO|nr:hypothetical protein [Leifsonia shinshuensis]NYJ22796.1 hypothetical protein [Leifsonia shinshuensis]